MPSNNSNTTDQINAAGIVEEEAAIWALEEVENARRAASGSYASGDESQHKQVVFSGIFERTVSNTTQRNGRNDLYDGKDWKESICPEVVDQGGYGDCFFLAALSSLANTDKGKQKIHDMITANEDGSFLVRFPGDSNRPIHVSDAELKQWNFTNSATWANVLETAFMKQTRSGGPHRNIVQPGGIPLFGLVSNTREAAKLLSGDDVITDQFALTNLGSQQLTLGWTSRDNVKRDLAWAMENQAIVTAGSSFGFAKFIGGHSPNNLVAGHAFSVLDFDEESETVIVRNPWSHNPAPLKEEGDIANGVTSLGDGKLSMSLDTFMKNFSDLTISGGSNTSTTALHLLAAPVDAARHGISAFKHILRRDGDKALEEVNESEKALISMGTEALHGVTTTYFEYLKHNLGNPGLAFTPGLSPATFIAKEVINHLPQSAPEQGE